MNASKTGLDVHLNYDSSRWLYAALCEPRRGIETRIAKIVLFVNRTERLVRVYLVSELQLDQIMIRGQLMFKH